jgi:hypothetical protein
MHQTVQLVGLVKGTTYLVEIIYLENTIVIPYPYEGLVLLRYSLYQGTFVELQKR